MCKTKLNKIQVSTLAFNKKKNVCHKAIIKITRKHNNQKTYKVLNGRPIKSIYM